MIFGKTRCFSCAAAKAGLVLTTLAFSVPSYAGFVVLDGNSPEPGEENILLGGDTTGLSIIGTTNQSGTQVLFTSPSQLLSDPSSGQARIEAVDGLSDQVAVDDSITVSLVDPSLSYGDLIFNAFKGGGLGTDGTLTIIVGGFDSNDAPLSQPFTLDDDGDPLTIGNGSNFYTVLASGGDRITSVEISPDANTSYADLRQIRISQIVPEPASIVLLALSGAIAFVRRQR